MLYLAQLPTGQSPFLGELPSFPAGTKCGGGMDVWSKSDPFTRETACSHKTRTANLHLTLTDHRGPRGSSAAGVQRRFHVRSGFQRNPEGRRPSLTAHRASCAGLLLLAGKLSPFLEHIHFPVFLDGLLFSCAVASSFVPSISAQRGRAWERLLVPPT